MVSRTTTLDSDPKIESAGETIRALREEAGLNLTQLAERIGWDKGRLSKYETNQLAMSVSVIDRIAEGLGKPPLVVLLLCLKHRYPGLRTPDSRVGTLLQRLVNELSGEPPARKSS